jgi:hypothetical protein
MFVVGHLSHPREIRLYRHVITDEENKIQLDHKRNHRQNKKNAKEKRIKWQKINKLEQVVVARAHCRKSFDIDFAFHSRVGWRLVGVELITPPLSG